VSSGQVLGSIAGFGLIYLGLLSVWLYVLDQKIRHGPEPIGPPDHGGRNGVVATATRRRGRASAVARKGR